MSNKVQATFHPYDGPTPVVRRPVRCRLGWHVWRHGRVWDRPGSARTYKACRNCGKEVPEL